jgi:hypothetical protein
VLRILKFNNFRQGLWLMVTMTFYEKKANTERLRWEKRMMRRPGMLDRTAKKIQNKINSVIPEKIHAGITRTIKEMVRAVLFGAKYTTRKRIIDTTLEVREAIALERIDFYKKTAATEGRPHGCSRHSWFFRRLSPAAWPEDEVAF